MVKHSDCILFATADWQTPYWTNKQHTARSLAEFGRRVLYVESIGLRTPCLGSGRDWSRIGRRLRRGLSGVHEVEKNIWVLSPLLIPFKHHWPIIKAFNQRMLRWTIGHFMRRHSFVNPVVWAYHPFITESLPAHAIGPLVYHCVDDLAALSGIDAEAFNRAEQKFLARADAVFTTSPVLRDKCLRYNSHVYDFPNVADIEHFQKAYTSESMPADLATIPQPRIGYIGVLSDFKVNFPLVFTIAQSHPQWHWVFIGEEREGQNSQWIKTLRGLPNVHFLGFKHYATLPGYLSGIDVATLPTLLNDYTKAMFPMKYFEYLAAGVPIVSTPLEFTHQHSAGMEVADTAERFADAIEKQLKRGRLSLAESVEHVGENTWRLRLDKMMKILEETT